VVRAELCVKQGFVFQNPHILLFFSILWVFYSEIGCKISSFWFEVGRKTEKALKFQGFCVAD